MDSNLEEEAVEVTLASFEYEWIHSSDAILLIHPNMDQSIVYINRMLRMFKYEFGTIFTPNPQNDVHLFRYANRVELFESKSFTKKIQDIHNRQSFTFAVTEPLGGLSSPLHPP